MDYSHVCSVNLCIKAVDKVLAEAQPVISLQPARLLSKARGHLPRLVRFILLSMKLSVRQLWTLVIVGLIAAVLAGFAYVQLQNVQLQRVGAPQNQLEYYGTPLDNPVQIAPFTLTDARGERVTLGKWRGDLMLVFFGFTRCPDVCPLTLGRLAKVYEDLGQPRDLRVVMVTVDPQYDTPKLTQKYAAGFNPYFVGLGGSSSDIAKAAKTFFVGYRGLKSDDFLHTDSVALLDREGKMRFVYGQDKVARLSEDLPKLLASSGF